MGAKRNYGRFYSLLKRMPGADKETIVEQFTNGRTVHLHLTTAQEYRLMCDEMERVVGYDERREALKKELRKKRSLCLHLMQQIGVDTADWATVDNFCKNPKIGGKRFAQMSLGELDAMQVKLRMIQKHGGLKKPHSEPGQGEKRKTTYLIVKMNNAGEA